MEDSQNCGNSRSNSNTGGEKRALDLSPTAPGSTQQLSPENKKRCVPDPMVASFSSSKHIIELGKLQVCISVFLCIFFMMHCIECFFFASPLSNRWTSVISHLSWWWLDSILQSAWLVCSSIVLNPSKDLSKQQQYWVAVNVSFCPLLSSWVHFHSHFVLHTLWFSPYNRYVNTTRVQACSRL